MKPEDVLQNCIDEVLAGSKTPAECARQYPQLADLEADLQMAVALQRMHALTLSANADQQIETRLRRQTKALRAAERPARRWLPALSRRWVLGPALVAILLLSGIGTAAAAVASNPGDWLYGVKRADESAQIFLSPTAGRAWVYTGLARRRLDELGVVLQRTEPDAASVNLAERRPDRPDCPGAGAGGRGA